MARKAKGPPTDDPRLVSQVMSAMGKKGGENSRKNLNAKEKTALAQKAASARWGKKKGEA